MNFVTVSIILKEIKECSPLSNNFLDNIYKKKIFELLFRYVIKKKLYGCVLGPQKLVTVLIFLLYTHKNMYDPRFLVQNIKYF